MRVSRVHAFDCHRRFRERQEGVEDWERVGTPNNSVNASIAAIEQIQKIPRLSSKKIATRVGISVESCQEIVHTSSK